MNKISKTLIAIILGISIILLATSDLKKMSDVEYNQQIKNSYKLVDDKDYDGAESELDKAIKHKNTSELENKRDQISLFKKASTKLEKKDYESAKTDFQAVKNIKFGYSVLTQRAMDNIEDIDKELDEQDNDDQDNIYYEEDIIDPNIDTPDTSSTDSTSSTDNTATNNASNTSGATDQTANGANGANSNSSISSSPIV